MPRVSLLFLSEAAEQWMKVSSWRGARRFASRESIGADNQWIGQAPLHVWHNERADRAVITPVPEAHMAMVILIRLNLLALEQVACRDVEPAGNCLHQLIAGNCEAIHVAAAD